MTPHSTEKKLLLVADTYYPKVDGTLKFIEEFIRRAGSDFKISLLVPYLGKKENAKCDSDHICAPMEKLFHCADKKIPEANEKIIYVQPSQLLQISGYQNMKLNYSNFQRIKTAIQKSDLVFIQGPALLSYLSIYYSQKYKKNAVFYVHVIPWELFARFIPKFIRKPFLALFRKIAISFYNKCDEILVPYHELQEQLKRVGVRTKISVAALGVDIQTFTPAKDKRLHKHKLGIPTDKTVIGYVGRISKEKNVHTLLEAFRKLENQDKIHLLIVGDGPEKQKADFPLLQNCTVTGFVNNVQDYLKAMDIFVMPSSTETTSLATLEAMACGLPVVATKVGFMKSYIVKNHNGIFVPRSNPTVLSLKLKSLLDDSQLREQLGQNARKTVAYSFSWERSINRIKRLLSGHFYQELSPSKKEGEELDSSEPTKVTEII